MSNSDVLHGDTSIFPLPIKEIDLKAAAGCSECEGTGWVWEPCHRHADFCPHDCNSDIPCGECQEHMYAR